MWLSTGKAAAPQGSATRAKLSLPVLTAGWSQRGGRRGVRVGGSGPDMGETAQMEELLR